MTVSSAKLKKRDYISRRNIPICNSIVSSKLRALRRYTFFSQHQDLMGMLISSCQKWLVIFCGCNHPFSCPLHPEQEGGVKRVLTFNLGAAERTALVDELKISRGLVGMCLKPAKSVTVNVHREAVIHTGSCFAFNQGLCIPLK